MANRAVFLDRDGTICVDYPDEHYIMKDSLDIFPYTAEAIKMLNTAGFLVIVVTNQPGISKGFFSTEKLKRMHEELKQSLLDNGAHIDAIYYCPHVEKEGCYCRKPKFGMLYDAKKDWNINLEASFVVGDSGRDIKMGADCGCTTIFINGNHYTNTKPDYVADDLLVAAGIILGMK